MPPECVFFKEMSKASFDMVEKLKPLQSEVIEMPRISTTLELSEHSEERPTLIGLALLMGADFGHIDRLLIDQVGHYRSLVVWQTSWAHVWKGCVCCCYSRLCF